MKVPDCDCAQGIAQKMEQEKWFDSKVVLEYGFSCFCEVCIRPKNVIGATHFLGRMSIGFCPVCGKEYRDNGENEDRPASRWKESQRRTAALLEAK